MKMLGIAKKHLKIKIQTYIDTEL